MTKNIEEMTYSEIKGYVKELEAQIRHYEYKHVKTLDVIDSTFKYYENLHNQAFQEWIPEDRESEREFNITFGSCVALRHVKSQLDTL